MANRIPIVIGNWKLNPTTVAEAKTLFLAVKRGLKKGIQAEVVVSPPFPFIPDLSRLSAAVVLAAQDVFYEESGAFTGEVSPAMLLGFGVTYVIVGHSERRALGESDDQVERKVQVLLRRKMTPVVCIGERERDERGDYFGFVEKQLRSVCKGLTAKQVSQVVIAYEPVWAIGTGKSATVDDVKEMQLFIVSLLTKLYDRATAGRVRIIYGGSVKAENAADLHQVGGMNGFLVGGASLKAEDFLKIIGSVIVR